MSYSKQRSNIQIGDIDDTWEILNHDPEGDPEPIAVTVTEYLADTAIKALLQSNNKPRLKSIDHDEALTQSPAPIIAERLFRSAKTFLIDGKACSDISFPSPDDPDDDNFSFYIYGKGGVEKEYFISPSDVTQIKEYAEGYFVLQLEGMGGQNLTFEPLTTIKASTDKVEPSVFDLIREVVKHPSGLTGDNPHFNEALGALQNKIGQNDGMTAGLFFDSNYEQWERGTEEDRINIVSEYIACEIQTFL